MEQRLLDLISNIQNARSDHEQTMETLEELLKEKEKLEDKIEGAEDDLKSDREAIERCEQELLDYIRDNEIVDIPQY